MSLQSPAVMNSWTDEADTDIHPSVPQSGDKYDNLGRNMSAQIRREKAWSRWILVQYRKKVY